MFRMIIFDCLIYFLASCFSLIFQLVSLFEIDGYDVVP